MSIENNTYVVSGTSTYENEITNMWNPLDDSVAEQSVQQGTENDERNRSQEFTEEEVEEFIRREQQATTEGNNADTDSKYTPQIGMEFETRDDAHHFFSFYDFIAGFEVVVTHTTKQKEEQ